MSAELLRQCLQSIQAHAAGMHAAADMALRIMGEMRTRSPVPDGPMYGGRPAMHYGDPVQAATEVLEELERNGGLAPMPADGGKPSAQE